MERPKNGLTLLVLLFPFILIIWSYFVCYVFEGWLYDALSSFLVFEIIPIFSISFGVYLVSRSLLKKKRTGILFFLHMDEILILTLIGDMVIPATSEQDGIYISAKTAFMFPIFYYLLLYLIVGFLTAIICLFIKMLSPKRGGENAQD